MMKVFYRRDEQGMLIGEVRGGRLYFWLGNLLRRRKSPSLLPSHLHADLGLPAPPQRPVHPALPLWR